MMQTSSLDGIASGRTAGGVGSAGRLLRALTTQFTIVLMALAIIVVLSPADAQQPKAKSLTGVFGGFAGDTNAPIDIEADRLVVSDNKKMAVFTGNVKAVQGEFTLRTPRLEVYYSSGSPASGAKSASGSEIRSLKALQKVQVTSGPDQSATGDEAVFDVLAQTVVLTGKVVVKQGKNIITGERLFIDLKNNTTRLDPGRGGGAKPGRVKMIIHRDAVTKAGRKTVSKPGVRPARRPGTSGWSSKTQPRN